MRFWCQEYLATYELAKFSDAEFSARDFENFHAIWGSILRILEKIEDSRTHG